MENGKRKMLVMFNWLIKTTKKYIRRYKQNHSVLVENFLNNENTNEIEVSQKVLELSGIIRLSENGNLRDIYRKHIEKKFFRI